MLSTEIHPDHDSMALVKGVLHGQGNADEMLRHLRETMSDNVIVSGWLNEPQADDSPEAMIAALRVRVEKFETNQHLREMEGQVEGDINPPQ